MDFQRDFLPYLFLPGVRLVETESVLGSFTFILSPSSDVYAICPLSLFLDFATAFALLFNFWGYPAGATPYAILFAKGRKLSKILLQQNFADSVNIPRSYCKQKVTVLQVFGQVAGNITKAGHINCVLSAF